MCGIVGFVGRGASSADPHFLPEGRRRVSVCLVLPARRAGLPTAPASHGDLPYALAQTVEYVSGAHNSCYARLVTLHERASCA